MIQLFLFLDIEDANQDYNGSCKNHQEDSERKIDAANSQDEIESITINGTFKSKLTILIRSSQMFDSNKLEY